MPTTVIRLASPADMPACAAMWTRLMRMHADLHAIFQLRADAPRLGRLSLDQRRRDPWTRIFVAQVDEARAGMLVAHFTQTPRFQIFTHRGYIGETYVDQAFRGRGLGKRLVGAACDWLEGLGADSIELQVAPGNPQGLRFWKSCGFEILTHHMARLSRRPK